MTMTMTMTTRMGMGMKNRDLKHGSSTQLIIYYIYILIDLIDKIETAPICIMYQISFISHYQNIPHLRLDVVILIWNSSNFESSTSSVGTIRPAPIETYRLDF